MWNGDHIGSSMISTGSTGTLRHVVTPNIDSMKRGKHVAVDRAAARMHRLARPHHVWSINGVADHLECEIGLHTGAHVEGAVMDQRPTAMCALDPT